MATSKDEQRAFIRKYQPAADVASKILFIPAEVLLAQWAKEADWGKKESGDFNFAGIKSFNPDEPRKEVQTWEVLTPAEVKKLEAQGKKVTPRPGVKNGYNIVDYFKSYDSPEQFAKEYAKTLIQSYPQAVGSENIEDFSYAIDSGRAQGKDSGFKVYATDPNYAKGLEEIYKYNVIPRKNEIITKDKGLDVSGPIGLPDLKNKEDIKRVQQAIGVKADGVWGPISKKAWKDTNDLFVTPTYREEGMQTTEPVNINTEPTGLENPFLSVKNWWNSL